MPKAFLPNYKVKAQMLRQRILHVKFLLNKGNDNPAGS
jgi:hypothetical protein